ncbi:hypothetical protein Sjap_004911 [Stephania japonica]|uniref:Uncharacterized protein n=1 Tax=Stephania japonica TaxID=461633 RepID=A0AAP0K4L2_9MAGN
MVSTRVSVASRWTTRRKTAVVGGSHKGAPPTIFVERRALLASPPPLWLRAAKEEGEKGWFPPLPLPYYCLHSGWLEGGDPWPAVETPRYNPCSHLFQLPSMTMRRGSTSSPTPLTRSTSPVGQESCVGSHRAPGTQGLVISVATSPSYIVNPAQFHISRPFSLKSQGTDKDWYNRTPKSDLYSQGEKQIFLGNMSCCVPGARSSSSKMKNQNRVLSPRMLLMTSKLPAPPNLPFDIAFATPSMFLLGPKTPQSKSYPRVVKRTGFELDQEKKKSQDLKVGLVLKDTEMFEKLTLLKNITLKNSCTP